MSVIASALLVLTPTAAVAAALPSESAPPKLHEEKVSNAGIGTNAGCNPADLAPPHGVLDFNDVVAYLNAFSAGDPAAEFAPPSDSLDFNDVIGFLNAFSSGEFQQYTDVQFNEVNQVGPYAVQLNGNVSVAPDGLANGSVNLTFFSEFGPPLPAQILISNNKLVMDLLAFQILLNNLDFLSIIVTSDMGFQELPLHPIMDGLENVFQNPQPINALPPEVIFVIALSAMGQNEQWAQNVATDRCNASRSPGFWCKAAAIACGAAITTLATAGCLALTGTCAVGTTVSFGGLAIPCTGLIALCAGGVFAGGAAAYELCLAAWD